MAEVAAERADPRPTPAASLGPPPADGGPLHEHHISGRIVRVRLGLALVVAAAGCALALGIMLVRGAAGRWGPQLALTAVSANVGVWGVIRCGLFTEGCGVDEVRRELHLTRLSYVAGGTARRLGATERKA